MSQVQKSLCPIHYWVNPFFSFLALGNKKWAPQYKDQEVGKIMEQNQLNGLQTVQFECPSTETPVSHPFLEESLFLIFSSLG